MSEIVFNLFSYGSNYRRQEVEIVLSSVLVRYIWKMYISKENSNRMQT